MNKKVFPHSISRPAQRALVSIHVTKLEDLATISEQRLLQLHGMGPNAIAQIKEELRAIGKSLAD